MANQIDDEEMKFDHQQLKSPVYDSVNEELTIESMFKVFDKDAGKVLDLREILDLKETDFDSNEQLKKVIAYMNKKEPLTPQKKAEAEQIRTSYQNIQTLPLLSEMSLKSIDQQDSQNQLFDSSWQDWWEIKMRRNQELIIAIQKHNSAKVIDLLNEKKYWDMAADVNYQPSNDSSPLHYAVQIEDLEICKILVEHLAEINAQNQMGRTPLHMACDIGNIDIVIFLTQRSEIFLEVEDELGNTPIHLAAKEGHLVIVQHLVEVCCVSPNSKNLSQKKPLQLATDISVIEYLKGYLDDSKNFEKRDSQKKKESAHKLQKVLKKTINLFSSFKGKKKKDDAQLEIQQQQDSQQNTQQQQQQQVFEKKVIQIQEFYQSQEEEKNINLKSFNVIERLGKGSFGSVYLVEKKNNQKVYAMKVLEKSKVLKQNLVRYAMTERNVLCLASHPFIVSLNFAFQSSQRLYLLLDYCPGGDMGLLLSRQRRFTEEIARMYLCEIILALEYLHQNKIVFRDLKPDNVVFDEDGHALLTDFGLSKEGLGGSQQSQSFCGSVAYLAPEMLKRIGHTKSIDWYLSGVLLYEMIVGVPPYFSTDRQKLFENIQCGPLKIPHTMSENAKNLILQLLNRNPQKRLGAGPRDSEEIKEHPFFDGVDWNAVLQRKLPVPASKIRKIEANPVSIKSFLLEEERNEFETKEEKDQQIQQPIEQQNLQAQNLKDKRTSKKGRLMMMPQDPNKIAGWSYIKKTD